MSRLDSLPAYFKEAQSPKILDSAFPPFKTKHRYRGVYERAGFDVNLGGRTQDGKSIRTNTLPTHSKHSQNTKNAPDPRHQKPYSGHSGPNPIPTGMMTPSTMGTDFERRVGSQTSLPSHSHQKPVTTNRHNASYPALSPIDQQQRAMGPSSSVASLGLHDAPYYPGSPHVMPSPAKSSFSQGAPDGSSPYGQASYRSHDQSQDQAAAPRPPFTPSNDPYATPTKIRGPQSEIPVGHNIAHSVNASISQLVNPSQHSLQPSIQQSTQPSSQNSVAPSIGSVHSTHSSEAKYNAVPGHRHQPSDLYGDNFDFSPQPNQYYNTDIDEVTGDVPVDYSESPSKKNVKNLSLKLANSNIANANVTTNPETHLGTTEDNENASEHSNLFNEEGNYDYTQDTSIARDGSPNLTGAVVEEASPSYLPYPSNELVLGSGYNNNNVDNHNNYNNNDYIHNSNYDANNDNGNFNHTEDDLLQRDQSLVKKHNRLSLSLNDFKRDVEDAKKHTPPTNSDARFQQQNSLTVGGGSEDYQQFLNGGSQKNARHSQLSMVSSILSKESINDEDAEIERELERQLQMMKMGGNEEDAFQTQNQYEVPQVVVSDASHMVPPEIIVEQHHQEPAAHVVVPTFNIQEEGDYDKEIPFENAIDKSTVRFVLPISEDMYPLDDTVDLEDEESEPPTPVSPVAATSKKHDHISSDLPYDPRRRQRKDPYVEAEEVSIPTIVVDDVPLIHQSDADDSFDSIPGLSINHSHSNSFSHTIEHVDGVFIPTQPTIVGHFEVAPLAPLNPKNHSIEEELKALNLPNESASPSVVYPPGKGPCRSCGKNILSNATGGQKAIFSKTGELSGQWHRTCFICCYDGCDIRFKKGIQCYALYDKPFCNHHYHELNGTLCQKCGLGIEGECIENELGQKWHLKCLNCHECGNGIVEDYYLINGLVFCENDALSRIQRDEIQAKTDKIEKRRTRLMFVD